MDLKEFSDLPDEARLWIYGFENPLDDEAQRLIREQPASFVERWGSHKVPVRGALSIQYDRFVLLAGVSSDGISGCSIDSSVRNFKALKKAHGLDGLNRRLVYYRDHDRSIRALDRAAFQAEVEAGRCHDDTPVFDTTLQTLGELRAGRFELPLSSSWHARAFMRSRDGRPSLK